MTEDVARARRRVAAMDEAGVRAFVDTVARRGWQVGDDLTLEILGPRASPAILAALKAERFGPANKAPKYTSGVDLLLRHLESEPDDGAAAVLEPWLGYEDYQFRQGAAITLGAMGRQACVEPLRRAFDQGGRRGEELLTSGLVGVHRALAGDRATPEFRGRMFDVLAPLIDRKVHASESVAQILMKLDRGRAVPLVLEPTRWTPDPEGDRLGRLMSACIDEGVAVPAALVLPLLGRDAAAPAAGATDGLPDPPNAAALRLLARAKHPSAPGRIEAALRFESEVYKEAQWARDAAALALLEWHGLGGAYDRAFERSYREKWEDLPEPVRHVVAVRGFEEDVGRYGLADHLAGCDVNDFRRSLAGLDATGAKRAAAKYREAAALFGPGGLGADAGQRRKQFERLPVETVGRLEQIGQALDRDPDHLGVLIARYTVKHADAFRLKTQPAAGGGR
jgi:hypothetical protein